MKIGSKIRACLPTNRKTLAKVAVVLALQFAGAEAAFAQQALAPLQAALDMVVDFVNGPFGRSVGVLAVMGLGFAAFAGRISVVAALTVILGMGFVFGAPSLVDTFQSVASR